MELLSETRLPVWVAFAFCLHIAVNYLNRVINELFMCGANSDRSVFNCSFPLMLVLLALLKIQPCNFSRYCYILVMSELLLQLLYVLWQSGLHHLLLCYFIPCLKALLGGLTLWKILLLLPLLGILWCVLCKMNWGGGDKDCGCECCDSTSSKESYLRSTTWGDSVSSSTEKSEVPSSCAPSFEPKPSPKSSGDSCNY